MDCNSDDDVPQLSIQTFAALQEFYKEQEERESKLSQTNNNASTNIQENWVFNEHICLFGVLFFFYGNFSSLVNFGMMKKQLRN